MFCQWKFSPQEGHSYVFEVFYCYVLFPKKNLGSQ